MELCPELCQAGIITGTPRFIDEQAKANQTNKTGQNRAEPRSSELAGWAAENLESSSWLGQRKKDWRGVGAMGVARVSDSAPN